MTKFDPTIYAEVVYDGRETTAPARMGTPKDNQLQGTKLERLVELCGRVCYDSLGAGRSSADYHKHIAEVGHGSVWEHANFTVEFTGHMADRKDAAFFALQVIAAFANRPGVWLVFPEESTCSIVRATVNMRAAFEWDEMSNLAGMMPVSPGIGDYVREAVRTCAHKLAPQIVPVPDREAPALNGVTWEHVQPVHPEEKWVSILLGGSRGMSHEQVRHKWRVGISQRSTRYVDESKSPWVEHPLITAYNASDDPFTNTKFGLADGGSILKPLVEAAQEAYEEAAEGLEAWLTREGKDKHTARKQARGAARGYLGNALHTELIFSASVAQWRRMLGMRCSAPADAEIRVLYAPVLRALQASRWSGDFTELSLVPSPDGIGEVVNYTDPTP